VIPTKSETADRIEMKSARDSDRAAAVQFVEVFSEEQSITWGWGWAQQVCVLLQALWVCEWTGNDCEVLPQLRNASKLLNFPKGVKMGH
jgi:hypothetical protein